MKSRGEISYSGYSESISSSQNWSYISWAPFSLLTSRVLGFTVVLEESYNEKQVLPKPC